MFDYSEYYKAFNGLQEARYQEIKAQLEKFAQDMTDSKDKSFRSRMMQYSKAQASYLLNLSKLESKWVPDYYQTASLAALTGIQQDLYGDLMDGYSQSYANPEYMVAWVGKELGPVLALFAALFHGGATHAFYHRRFMLLPLFELYFQLHHLLLKKQVRADELISLYRSFIMDNLSMSMEMDFHQRMDVSDRYIEDILDREDLTEPYYLYTLGLPVPAKARIWQKFFKNLPEDRIERMAKAAGESFIQGALEKDPQKEKTLVRILYPFGCERLAKKVEAVLNQQGYEGMLRPDIDHIFSPKVAQDHRYDLARIFGQDELAQRAQILITLTEENTSLLQGFAGQITLVSEETAEPEPALPQTAENELHRKPEGYISEMTRSIQRQMVRQKHETFNDLGYFTSIARVTVLLPSVESGEPNQLEKLSGRFDRYVTAAEKRMDSSRSLINVFGVLEGAEGLYLEGKGDNETDLVLDFTVKGWKNACDSSLNSCLLPGGYLVFKPNLHLTNGLLHLEKSVIMGMSLTDLKLTFDEGRVTGMSCREEETEEDAVKEKLSTIINTVKGLPLTEAVLAMNTDWYCQWMQNKEADPEDLPQALTASRIPSIVLGRSLFDVGASENDLLARSCQFAPDDKIAADGRGKDQKENADLPKQQSDDQTDQPSSQEEEPSSPSSLEDTGEGKTDINEDGYEDLSRLPSIRLTIPFESIGRLSVIRQSQLSQDLIREGLFVPIGTDSLNTPLLKRKFTVIE